MRALMWRRFASQGITLALAALIAALIPSGPRSHHPLSPSGSATVDVAIRATRDLRDALDVRGARVGTVLPVGGGVAGRVVTASIDVAMLPDISRLPGVYSVTVGDRLTPQLDQATSAAQTGAADVARSEIGRAHV